MTALPIVMVPDERLSEIAEPVQVVNDEIRKIIDDMFETMHANKCVGFAATQIGVNRRILVIDLPKSMDETEPRYAIINPEVTYLSEETWTESEGSPCLPLQDKIKITRPSHIKLKYLDNSGNQKDLSASGWLARTLQHEIDHLNGITIVNYLSKMRRDMIIKKLAKYKKTFQK